MRSNKLNLLRYAGSYIKKAVLGNCTVDSLCVRESVSRAPRTRHE